MRRTLIFAATLAILVSAVVAVLGILDVIPFEDLLRDLRKILTIVVVCTVAALLIFGLLNLGKGKE